MPCANPKLIELKSGDWQYPHRIFVRCGKCYDCQCHLRANFALRCWFEQKDSQDTYFLTLNYDDEHLAHLHAELPYEEAFTLARSISNKYSKLRRYDSFLLNKKDIQLFLRRLNYFFSDKYGKFHYVKYVDKHGFINRKKKYDVRIRVRYCAIGEYGDLHHRPHFHVLLFLPIKLPVGAMNQIVSFLWTFERPSAKQVGTVTPASINYVGKHQVKSCQGSVLQQKLAPIFSLNSKYQGGIGRTGRDSEQMKNNYFSNQKYFQTKDGYTVGIGRFFSKYFHPDPFSEEEIIELCTKSFETAKLNYLKPYTNDFEFIEIFSNLSQQFRREDYQRRVRYEQNRLNLKMLKNGKN